MYGFAGPRNSDLRGYLSLTQFKHSAYFLRYGKAHGNEMTVSQASLVISQYFTFMGSFTSLSQALHCLVLNTIMLSVLYLHVQGGLCGLHLHIFTFSMSLP